MTLNVNCGGASGPYPDATAGPVESETVILAKFYTCGYAVTARGAVDFLRRAEVRMRTPVSTRSFYAVG